MAELSPGAAGQRADSNSASDEQEHEFRRYCERARRALESGSADEAARWFRKAAELRPTASAVHTGLGEAYRRLGQREAALACFERAVELTHDDVAALVSLGEINAELGRVEEAADAFHLATAVGDASPGPWLGLARLARHAGDIDKSVAHLEHAISRWPNEGAVYFELGLSLGHRGDSEGAAAAYRRALAIDPSIAGAWVNLGLIQLSERGEAEAAETMFRRATTLDADLLAAQVNLGLALQEQGKFADALELYERELARRPSAELRWHRGMAHLARGEYALGWADYEARKALPRGSRKFPYPEWDGEPLAGKTILVYAEQGVGDEIMFASCLGNVVEQAAACVIECDPRLHRLFQRSFPRAAVHGASRDGDREWLKAYPNIGVQSAIASLPRFLRPARNAFPAHNGYLRPAPERVAAWRERFGRGDCRRTIGVAWRGGTTKTRQALRSVPIAIFACLLAENDLRIVSLQRGRHADEVEYLKTIHGERVWAFDAPLEDLDECAALIAALDLVISVDNTVVHLAGACGVPVWVLLPYSADWRYPWGRQETPWYPSARCIRQGVDRRWEPVMASVADRLRAWGGRGPTADGEDL